MHACVYVCVFLLITHRVREPARQLNYKDTLTTFIILDLSLFQ